ncbi:hypothetical protein C2845_PM14G04390 [Panicum miliaceum]|uniref:Uncharacterized protein n=1 Tax=Panicum miliaceum TaxID=4540 RepID=A0A3L6PSU8_PANMI|nr:hypothetical protein C2845_PM14G04390 [Panicum miliaceum]
MPRHRTPHHRRGTPAPPLNHSNRPGPSTPATAALNNTTCGCSEPTRTATPPAAQRLPTPTLPEETPRRPLVFHLCGLGCTAFGIGVIPDPYSTAAATPSNASFGPQAGPSNAGSRHAITSFTAANAASGLAGATMAAHPSFTIGTMAARRNAPPFFNSSGLSAAATSAASEAPGMVPASPSAATDATVSTAPLPARIFSRVAAMDRWPGIRHCSWCPAALGLSSGN